MLHFCTLHIICTNIHAPHYEFHRRPFCFVNMYVKLWFSYLWCMMTSSNGNIFRVTGPLSPAKSPHKVQWRKALMFSFICAWINGWVSNREAGDLIRHRAYYDVIVMSDFCRVFQVSFTEVNMVRLLSTTGTEAAMITAGALWFCIYQFNVSKA